MHRSLLQPGSQLLIHMAALQIGELLQRQNGRFRQRFIHYLPQQFIGIIRIFFQLRLCQNPGHILFLEILFRTGSGMITVCILGGFRKGCFQPA
ncbi:hypothetical protein D3C85_1579260 [compost metagenome]